MTEKATNKRFIIETKKEYRVVQERGYEPLLCSFLDIDINLRVQIQRELFGMPEIGKKNIPQANQKFYKWVWNHKPHYCEEFMTPLDTYSAVFISHIFTKGGFPEMAHDPRNTNIFSFKAHQMWENPEQRKKMRIYYENLQVMEKLKNDYANLRK